MGHRIDELPSITTPSDSDKIVVEHDNLTSQITLARLIAAERDRLNQLESALEAFGAGSFLYQFGTSELLTSQIDALPGDPPSTIFGMINSYGHMEETGVPKNSSFYVEVHTAAGGYRTVKLTNVGDADDVWTKSKSGGTWSSGWAKESAFVTLWSGTRITDANSYCDLSESVKNFRSIMFLFRTNAEVMSEIIPSDFIPSYYITKTAGIGAWNTTNNCWTYNAYINLQLTSETRVTVREASWNNQNLKIGLSGVYGISRIKI